MNYSVVVGLLLTSCWGWGCATRVSGPRDEVTLHVRFNATAGDSLHPIEATVTVTNGRSSRIYHGAPCAGLRLVSQLLGPDGNPVRLHDPRPVPPACPDQCCAPLDPGGALAEVWRFSGTLFTSEGEAYPAPSGEYTIVAGFSFSLGSPGESCMITRRAQFRWVKVGAPS